MNTALAREARRRREEALDDPWRLDAETATEEAFDDEYATGGDVPAHERGPYSRWAQGLLDTKCCGWRERPTAAETYAAFRADEPTTRQTAILATVVGEGTALDWGMMHHEGVFTWRRMRRAVQRTGGVVLDDTTDNDVPVVILKAPNLVDRVQDPRLGGVVHRALTVVLGLSDFVRLGDLLLAVERLEQVVTSVSEFVVGRNGDRRPKLCDFAREPIGGLVALGEFRDGRELGRHRSELARQHSLTLAIDVFASCELTLLQSNVSAAQVGHDPPVRLTSLGLVGSWRRRTGSDTERRACCLNQLLHRGLSLPALLSGVSRTRKPGAQRESAVAYSKARGDPAVGAVGEQLSRNTHKSPVSPVTGGERSTAQSLNLATSTPARSSSVTSSSCRGCPKTTR